MSLKSRINKINRLISASSSKQSDAVLKAKIEALQEEFRNMSDDELRAIADGSAPGEFQGLTDQELWEIIARGD